MNSLQSRKVCQIPVILKTVILSLCTVANVVGQDIETPAVIAGEHTWKNHAGEKLVGELKEMRWITIAATNRIGEPVIDGVHWYRISQTKRDFALKKFSAISSKALAKKAQVVRGGVLRVSYPALRIQADGMSITVPFEELSLTAEEKSALDKVWNAILERHKNRIQAAIRQKALDRKLKRALNEFVDKKIEEKFEKN